MGLRQLPPDHHVEFREAEDDRVALVGQDDVGRVAEILGEDRRQFEANKAGARYHPVWSH